MGQKLRRDTGMNRVYTPPTQLGIPLQRPKQFGIRHTENPTARPEIEMRHHTP